jgi:beta-xylosidase
MGLYIYSDMSNPIIRNKFTADPTALVFHNTVYLYTGHDEAPVGTDTYIMKDWCCFSSEDMLEWREHPVPLKATDFTWAKGDAYASKVLEYKNRFYWYAAVTPKEGEGKAIAVALSESPIGPFKDARGTPLIAQSMIAGGDNFDPTVLIDDDGSAWIFWGKKICYYARLSPDLLSLDGAAKKIDLPEFQEGAHVHKRDKWYYLSYGYEMPEKVAYAMSRSIHGPWDFKGILNDVPANSETNRPCIVDFKGNSYFFYHNGKLENGGSHHRSVCVDYLYYNADGTMKKIMMTDEGITNRRI